MDFPKSVPSVGLVDGKFIDEDAVAGTPGSLIPSAWGNAVTQEILKVIQEAGLDPDEDDNTQLNAAINLKISDSSTEFASQPEAEAGESTTKAMSPLRVFQAIAKVVTQATETAFGWLKIATLSQVNTGTNDATAVTPKKLAAAIQTQTLNAGTTGGTGTSYTLSNIPGLSSYVQKLRINVTFHIASGANPTIDVNGIGVKSLKQYDSSGAKVAAVVSANLISDLLYDGTDFVMLDALPVVANGSARGAFSNLKLSASGLNGVVSITAEELVLESAAGAYQTIRGLTATPSTSAAAGANGLDVGTVQPSTWYSVWVISNGANTVAGLLSLSDSSPVMPAGYTHKARISTIRTDSTANKFPFPFIQFGRTITYSPLAGSNLGQFPAIASGSATWPTSAGWQGYAPPWSSKLILMFQHAQAGQLSFSNSPNYQMYNDSGTTGNTNYDTLVCTPLNASIYYGAVGGSGGGALIQMMGWEENL